MLELADKPLNAKAWERFLELGLPTKESESYRYVRLKSLYSHPFHLPQSAVTSFQPQENTLVFVNGAYTESLSSVQKPLLALPLSRAIKSFGSFLNPRMHQSLKSEKDPFAALGRAYSLEGLFLYAPPKVICQTRLKIVHLIEGIDKPVLLSPSIYVFAGKGSLIKLSLSQTIDSERVWMNTFVDCALEENASVSLSALFNQNEYAHHFFNLRATLKEHSLFKSFSATNGGAVSRENYSIHLLGEKSSSSLQGVWGLSGARQHHVNIFMDHQEPGCTSLQKFKGFLSDHSKSSFEGKIYVHPKAQKTEAYQMNNNLILGQRASANSKPNLEIFADDVKASHGATVGRLDEEQLFYLRARGIQIGEAKKLLIKGFTRDLLDQIDDPALKQEALTLLA